MPFLVAQANAVQRLMASNLTTSSASKPNRNRLLKWPRSLKRPEVSGTKPSHPTPEIEPGPSARQEAPLDRNQNQALVQGAFPPSQNLQKRASIRWVESIQTERASVGVNDGGSLPSSSTSTSGAANHDDGANVSTTGPSSSRTTWFNACKLTLETAEGFLSGVPVPGLKGAIGLILKVINQFEVSVHLKSDLAT